MALIKPDVFASLIKERFEGRIILAKMATNLGYLMNEKHGERIRFPKWGTLSEAELMTRGIALTPEDLEQTDDYADVKQIGKAVGVYDVDQIQALGDSHINEAAEQIAKVMARAVDTDLGAELRKSPLKVTATSDFAERTDFAKAMTMFLDEQDAVDFSGIIINSLQLHFLYDWDDFVKLDLTTTTDDNGIVRSGGLCGYYRGIPIYMANSSTISTTSGKMYAYFIRKNALALMLQRDVNVETQRDIMKKATFVAGDMLYAVKVVDDSGVAWIESNIPTII